MRLVNRESFTVAVKASNFTPVCSDDCRLLLSPLRSKYTYYPQRCVLRHNLGISLRTGDHAISKLLGSLSSDVILILCHVNRSPNNVCSSIIGQPQTACQYWMGSLSYCKVRARTSYMCFMFSLLADGNHSWLGRLSGSDKRQIFLERSVSICRCVIWIPDRSSGLCILLSNSLWWSERQM